MAAPGDLIELAPGLLPALLLSLATLFALLVWGRRRAALQQRESSPEQDWSVPLVDAVSQGTSLFHRWDTRFKLASLLLLAFFMVATRSLAAALLALGLAVAALAAARIPWRNALRRLLAMAGFLSMFVVILPLTAVTRPGDTLLVFPEIAALPLNLRGLELALTICAKACAVALLMEPLLATAPLSTTLQALTRLGVPSKVGQMILLAHRYIFVFLEETRRMAVGMNVRGFRKRTHLDTLRVMGNFLGMLFIRSFERTHRVFDAMQARGYAGEFPGHAEFRATRSDWLKGALCILLGVALLVLDRLWLLA